MEKKKEKQTHQVGDEVVIYDKGLITSCEIATFTGRLQYRVKFEMAGKEVGWGYFQAECMERADICEQRKL